MSESPPHIPKPFPYVFAGPSIPAPRPSSSFNFSHSSSRSNLPKRTRSNSPESESASEDGTEEDSLDDPYDLAPAPEVEKDGDGGVIQETNVGMKMLMKLGWTQGKGLGKELQGRTQPVDPSSNFGLMGLGKSTQDSRMLNSTTLATRELESQRIAKETDDQKKARMERAKHKEDVAKGIKETLRNFHCDICSKGYANVSQYDEHTNSYDHHHRAREVALKQSERERKNATGESDKRREKERKREEKEMAKRMGAAGIKVPKDGVGVKVVAEPVQVKGDGVKKGGWASFSGNKVAEPVAVESAPSASTSAGGGGFKKGGWATIGGSQPAAPSAEVPFVPVLPPAPTTTSRVPAFQSGGMFSLSSSESTTTPNLPPPPPPSSHPPPPPPPPSSSMYVPPPPQSYTNYPSAPPPSPYPPPPPSYPPPPPHRASYADDRTSQDHVDSRYDDRYYRGIPQGRSNFDDARSGDYGNRRGGYDDRRRGGEGEAGRPFEQDWRAPSSSNQPYRRSEVSYHSEEPYRRERAQPYYNNEHNSRPPPPPPPHGDGRFPPTPPPPSSTRYPPPPPPHDSRDHWRPPPPRP